MACSKTAKKVLPNSELQNDRITALIEQSEKTTISAEQKLILNEAYREAQKLTNDSLRANYLVELSYQFIETDDTLRFREINKEALILTEQLKDSTGLANAYWDLADFFYYESHKVDSAYYSYNKAQQIYERLGDDFLSARILIRMATSQTDIKDYIGSEATTKKAIDILRLLKKDRELYSCYNNLGIISRALGNYEEALQAHEQALDYLKKTDRGDALEPRTLNNIGVVYKDQGNYQKAIEHYAKALKKNRLYAKDPKWEATFIDNIAYALFKNGDTNGVEEQFYKALRIRDSLGDVSGVIINKLHLAEYYATYQDTLKAIANAKAAQELATSSKNYRYLLEALDQLSNLERGEKSATYLKAYVKISDSLYDAEREFKDNIARIELETDDLRIENEKISQQITIIFWVALGIVGFLLLLFVIVRQRYKNRELILEKEKQEADAEITRLMLVQKTKMEEGSFRERKRISEELHDGVLGRLFGTRITMGSIDEIEDPAAAAAMHEHCVQELQKIEKEIRDISHKLNNASFIAKTKYITLINDLLEAQSKSGAFTYVVKNDNNISWKDVPDNIKFNVYRVIQESTQNIIKHSKASRVMVTFEQKGKNILTTIEDNGRGFDAENKKGGIGMKTMRSRIVNLSGELSIDSRSGEGTRIYITVPAFLKVAVRKKIQDRLRVFLRLQKKNTPTQEVSSYEEEDLHEPVS